MNQKQFERRKFINLAALTLGTMGLPACGGGGGAVQDNGTSNANSAPAPAPAPVTAPVPPPPPVVSDVVTRLSISSSAAGSRNFAATVLPVQGQVPSGKTLVSPDDGSLVCAVLSRWSDGSAAIMVASGTTDAASGTTASFRLQLGTPDTTKAALTPARIGQIVTSVKLDFGALGTVQLSDFSTPERIWWASSQVICARYRLRAPGHATLEAVVDVHAYAGGRAFVEIVVENARMVTTAPVKPADAAYNGTAYVNGVACGSAKSADAPEGTHSPFRAWYASSWVGGDPGLVVTQLVADLQKHPLLFKMDQPGNDNGGYAADTYAPWGAGRHRAQYMGSAGDDPSIGPLTLWDAQFLQTGTAASAHAVEVNALAILSYNVSYRDDTTGLVPNAAQLVGQSQQGAWPKTTNANEIRQWEVAHHPAVGLMAFACRPSPVHMETAQRIAVWNATWGAGGMGSANLTQWSGDGLGDGTGVFGFYHQPRGRAWCLRSLVHATFLSPDGSAWRDGGKYWMNLNRIYWDAWRSKQAAAALSLPWANGPDGIVGLPANKWPWPPWQTHFLIPELHKAAAAKLLSGSQQTAMESLADWVAEYPVRWINEQPNGGWRYHPYQQLIPSDAAGVVPSNWGALMAQLVTAPPPSVAGDWFMSNDSSPEYAAYFGEGVAGGGTGYYYISVYWSALVAAVERGIPGSATAWATVQSKVTSLNTWRQGFRANSRFGATPRQVGGQAV